MSSLPAYLIVIPVFNHAASLRNVVLRALEHGPVLVVDDGSTDLPPPTYTPASSHVADTDLFPTQSPLHGLPIYFARHERNMGKGQAILTGARIARQLGMTHIITLDADAQHFPEDIPAFAKALQDAPTTLCIGQRDFATENVPASSRFGRWFSNFWHKVHTGQKIGDSQCGFRAYPLVVFDALQLTESRYSFEIEILVRAAWAGFSLADIPIRVQYLPGNERISHFHAFWDNARLTLLNTRFTIRSILPIPQKHFTVTKNGEISPLRPLQSLQVLLRQNETPKNLALAGGLGVLIGVLPIFGLHSLLIILILGTLGLNKFTGIATSQLCMPPLVPALCIETGYFFRFGDFLTEISWQTLGSEAWQRLWEWLLGSLLLAPTLGIACGLVIYLLARSVQQGLHRLPEVPHEPTESLDKP